MLEDFGPYQIVRKVAVGGMAEIYLARQRGIEGVERTVILKRILPTYSGDDEFTTMFLDEARLMAALCHPNIAQVFDVGHLDDAYFLVMEHVRGPTLGAMLQAAQRDARPGLPEREALGIALGVAEALSYVHGLRDELGRPLNIVHRDLNPANVMVSYDGAVKLIDFGIAKTARKVYETRTGVIKGTYGYMAPEQLKRDSSIDHRADVFAMGVMLYEMCLGRHPFDASDEPNFIDRLLRARYKRPRQVNPSFPTELDALIVSCLAPRPEGRPSDVRTLIDQLIAYLESRGMVPTMGDIATLARTLVPDREGPAPLKRLTSVGKERKASDDSKGEPTRPVASGEGTIRTRSNPQIVPDVDLRARVAAEDTERTPRDAPSARPIRDARRPAGARGPSRGALIATIGSALVVIVGLMAYWGAQAWGDPRDDGGASALGPAGDVPTDAPPVVIDAAPPRPTTVQLRILSEPAGATASVDGRAAPSGTPTEVTLAAGIDSVWVRVEMAGYIPQERAVQAAIGEARFVLTPDPAADAGPGDGAVDGAGVEPAEEARPPRRRRRGRHR